MTHMQAKIGKGSRFGREVQVEDECECGSTRRRPVLISCNDVDMMAMQSSRARLINQLVSKPDDPSWREFSSYYRAPTKYADPPYSITSHTNGMPIPTVQQTIPSYPSYIQAQRPHSGSTSGHSSDRSETDLTVDDKFHCRCVNCTSLKCPSKYCDENKPHKFKDNIMTFCDRCTMTSNVQDVGCGRTPSMCNYDQSEKYQPRTYSAPAVSDDHSPKTQKLLSRIFTPVPILKKSCPAPVYCECFPKKVKESHNNCTVCEIEPSKTKSMKCFFKKQDVGLDCGYECEVYSKKKKYRDGCSNVVVKYPSALKKAPPPSLDCSRSSTSKTSSSYKSDSDLLASTIPYSHKNDSKFHKHCVEPPLNKELGREAGTATSRRLLIPRVIYKNYASKPCKRCKPQPRGIKLPKKVLTSEKLTEPCVTKYPHDRMPCRRK